MPRRIITSATIIDADAYQDGLTKRRDSVRLTIDVRSTPDGQHRDRAAVEITIPRAAIVALAEKAAKNRTRRATIGGMRARVIASSY